MSIVEKLTEGIVNRDMAREGEALLNKWSSTGLLEGLQNDQDKHNMARLLENQAKELLREASGLAGGSIEGFAAVAFPIVRRVFAGLIANDLVSVQPMSLPSGLIFFLDFTFSGDAGAAGAQVSPRMGNTKDKSIYGTNQLGSGIIDGVDLVDATSKAGFSGPGRDGSTGYAYGSPSGSITAAGAAVATAKCLIFALDGAVSETNQKLVKYDVDLLNITDSSLHCAVLDIDVGLVVSTDGAPDFNNLSAFQISSTDLATAETAITTATQIRRLSDRVSNADSIAVPGSSRDAIRFVFTVDNSSAVQAATVLNANFGQDSFTFPIQDRLKEGAGLGSLEMDDMALEGNEFIPEIDIKVDSTAITAQTKKLKAKWTPELGQDLNAYHNLDAEVELTSILSEQIALEIDREILADLVNGATAATYYWSRSPGLFVNR